MPSMAPTPKTMTNKEALWRSYYAAVKAGKRVEAQQILKQIHSSPKVNRKPGGCSRCRKRF